MTIDEAIVFCEAKSENIKLKAEPQTFIDIAEWLKELKDYRDKNKMVVRVDVENIDSLKEKLEEIEKVSYNKAIDDYCNRLCDNGSIADFMKDYFRDVAKELKGGKK